MLQCSFAVISECAVELNVDNVKKMPLAAVPLAAVSSDVNDIVEKRICSEYLFMNAAVWSDIQLIAFKKFKGRFSAFIMNSSRDQLKRLIEWYLCGKLKGFLEPTVGALVQDVRIKRINWSMKDFDRCNKHFHLRDSLLQVSMSNNNSPSSSLSQTPPSFDFSKITIGTAT